MAAALYTYELSQEADNDLQEIYEYTAEKFGGGQAVKYLTGIEELFYAICAHPHTGRERGEIRKGLRSSSYTSHVVFYRIMEDESGLCVACMQAAIFPNFSSIFLLFLRLNFT